MKSIAQKEIKTESLTVKRIECLTLIQITPNGVAARYSAAVVLPDSSELPSEGFAVDRPLNGDDQETAAWIATGIALAAKWRAEDLEKQAADSGAAHPSP